MVEVYRTDVGNQEHADFLLHQLGNIFPAYRINFDLEDCDKILRVESVMGEIEVLQLIEVLKDFGCTASLLEDAPPVKESKHTMTSGNGSRDAALG